MADQFPTLMHRFKDRLESMEQGKHAGGSDVWRLCCLERALEFLEEDPEEAAKHLDEFDRLASVTETTETFDKFTKLPDIKDIRARFDNLGGGIV